MIKWVKYLAYYMYYKIAFTNDYSTSDYPLIRRDSYPECISYRKAAA
jgi:hypothetical protein